MQHSGGRHSSFSGIKELSSSRGRAIKILLLGQRGVGKTAIAVRFATRRFIGEYDRAHEYVYRVDGGAPHLGWEIADPPDESTRGPCESRLRWADACLLVYSVTDRVSFDEIWRLRFLVNQATTVHRGSFTKRLHHQPPVVLLVGNKTDLQDGGPPEGDRMVTTEEGRARAKQIEADGFWEVSARESYDQVMAVFVNAARLVARREEQQRASSSSFRLRASTDGSIDRRRRPQIQASGIWLRERRFSISSRGAPD